jgi:ATP-dependent Clp protease ATP-binding subunit ClpC
MNWFKEFWKALTARPASEIPGFIEQPHNFTPRATQALVLARKEAERMHHDFVGTGHVLLGLIHLGQGVVVNVLGAMGVNLETVRAEVEKQVGPGTKEGPAGDIPFTPRVKSALALAEEERKSLAHTYLGTEHILLGLLRESEGVAGRVLRAIGVNVEVTRQTILKELEPNFETADEGTDTAR